MRKAIAARPRNAVVGGFVPLADAVDVIDGAAAASADDVDDVAAARHNAAPNVSPPEVWSDAVMNWRHPLTFVFVLNGPLTSWHPHPGSRLVCEFLKKAPRSGPQEGVRAVNREDGRRAQRADARGEARAEVCQQNDELLATLRQSRCDSSAALHTIYSHLTGRPKPSLPLRPTNSCDFSFNRMKPTPQRRRPLLIRPMN